MPALFLLWACATPAPEPVVEAVEPSRGWTGEATAVTIVGSDLLPVVSLGAPDPVAGDFEAWLLADPPVRLEGVTYADAEHLTATVPGGIEPGLYSLQVRTPGGAETERGEAFRVTRTRADHLSFVATSAAYDLGESAELLVELRDPDENLVAEAMTIAVAAISHATSDSLAFGETLDGQTAANQGNGIEGQLDPDGRGIIRLSSTIPDDVSLQVSSTSDEDIAGDELLISWNPGGLADVSLTFPFSPFVAQAGVPFSVGISLFDQFGNALDDTYARVLLVDDCSDIREVVDVVGSAAVELTLNSACPVDRLYALNQAVDVESDPFEVISAAVAGFQVTASPDEITAGVDQMLALVQAVDSFGNAVDDYAGPVALSDTAGGYDSDRSKCPDLENGVQLCNVYLNAASPLVKLLADDGAGHTGESNEIVVYPDVPASVLVTVMDLSVTAGEPFGVNVEVVDAWGNSLEIEPGGSDPVNFVDNTGTVSCAWTGPVGDFEHAFSCSVTGAGTGNTLIANVPSLGVAGSSFDAFDVENSELAAVDFLVPTSSVAGQSFAFAAYGYDAYGNPYLIQTDPNLDLGDTSGTLDISSLVLDTAGQAFATGSITFADENIELIASRGGVELGRSTDISVAASTMAAFWVSAPAWIEAGEPATFSVTAVDAFGNRVQSYAGTAELTASTSCNSATTPAFASGRASIDLSCDVAALGVSVTAQDSGGNLGVSDPFDVVDLGCAAGPTAALAINGEAEPVVCLAGDTATVSLDGAGSAAGDQPISVYQFNDSDGQSERGASAAISRTWTGAGAREVELVVVDAEGCASVISDWAWVGADDGEPTGPVTLSASATATTTASTVAVNASAKDCRGDVAALQSLLVRADLGDISATATGRGQALTLGGTGETSTSWSFPAGYAGTATLYAGTTGAGAYGELSVVVSGDSARPHVVEVVPSGFTEATWAEVVVYFDEAILESTVSNVGITGPSGAVLTTSALAGNVLTLTPLFPLDASLGTYTITVGSGLRDLAGNRLDGHYSGSASDFGTTFGNVADTLPISAGCGFDRTAIVPDGDDGSGSEADTVSITPVVSSSPSWWWLLVTDESDVRVRSVRSPGTDVSVFWDGRDDDGFFAASGAPTATLYAVDAQGNTAEICSSAIDVGQHVELP